MKCKFEFYRLLILDFVLAAVFGAVSLVYLVTEINSIPIAGSSGDGSMMDSLARCWAFYQCPAEFIPQLEHPTLFEAASVILWGCTWAIIVGFFVTVIVSLVDFVVFLLTPEETPEQPSPEQLKAREMGVTNTKLAAYVMSLEDKIESLSKQIGGKEAPATQGTIKSANSKSL